jgi:diaminohydroxyphosphoribosylaminopyrimidine deaminase/5-amino-6-(5-phosphoribosylamino)uracil reductase
MSTLDQSPVVVVVSPEADASALRDAGAEILVATGIRPVLAELGNRNITSLFLEGGPALAAAFADAGEIDEARVFIAPILLSGDERVPALDPGAEDTLIETRFKEW